MYNNLIANYDDLYRWLLVMICIILYMICGYKMHPLVNFREVVNTLSLSSNNEQRPCTYINGLPTH